MTIEQLVVEELKELPAHRQREVLDFVTSLKKKSKRKGPLKSLAGIWADLDIHITDEDIAEARREMWGNFPRDFPRKQRKRK